MTQEFLGPKPKRERGPVQVTYTGMSSDVKKALRSLARRKEGRAYLSWLMEFCGYKTSSLTMDADGHILTDAMIHNESLRSVWLETRRGLIDAPDLLNEIEKERVEDVSEQN